MRLNHSHCQCDSKYQQVKHNASKCMRGQIEHSGQVNQCDQKAKCYLSCFESAVGQSF